MRYQQPIYIQNAHNGVRNNDILNVNMSSDMCIFEAPLFNLSGASKLACVTGETPATNYHIITTATTVDITFDFTANTSSFSANSATFNYDVYKYRPEASAFSYPAVYRSESFQYSAFSGTNTLSQSIPISNLVLDGEYIVKGFYKYSPCTSFIQALGKEMNTQSFLNLGSDIYDPDLDFYFIAIGAAEEPILLQNGSNNAPSNKLFQQVIIPEAGINDIVISQSYAGDFVVTLNGLALAPNYDYSFSGNIVTLSGATVSGDIITIIYTNTGGNNLVGENIDISSAIVSGATDGQGTNTAYYNTSTNKYEVYTQIQPSLNGTTILILNGVTLANGIDYYQSTSNPKRFIIEGDLVVGDLITMVYFPFVSAVYGLITNTPSVSWRVNNPPQLNNGYFSLQVSTNSSFSSYFYSGATNYVIGETIYSDSFVASGEVGTKLYYRVKNEKDFVTICGDIITSTSYSDTIPVTIQTNSINSY